MRPSPPPVVHFHLCNTLLPSQTYQLLFDNHGVKDGNATQTFWLLLAQGLAKNERTRVTVHSVLPVSPSRQRKRFWNFPAVMQGNIRFRHVPAINLPLVNNVFTFCWLFVQLVREPFSKNHEHVIVVDYLRYTVNLAAQIAGWIKGVPVLAVVTDLPSEDVFEKTVKGRLRNALIVLLKYDFYVCVTSHLNAKVNLEGRPHLIMECVADGAMSGVDNTLDGKFPERTIVYAGGLYEEYGVRMLIEAFNALSDPDLRLWLYGVGPLVAELDKYVEADPRIEYQGVVLRDELISVLASATLLVNPRLSSAAYTLYSFPSKNMEYMSTGTPLVTTRLPGIPQDHDPFIFFFEDETVGGITETLRRVLRMGKQDLHVFGLRCKEFTLSEKSNFVQAKRIYDLVIGSKRAFH